ncbi:unnamed protein product [Brachionus calyciflorus]|uniref:Uncharacterized protein n=1 Tax=Brachionus calyciflorus TaxID=104777 RepID=A0A813PIF7_9BILA|nr:unnamed protein product [Brachionus calyciflorus]
MERHGSKESIKKQDSVDGATKEISTSQDNAQLANVKKFKQLIIFYAIIFFSCVKTPPPPELDRVFRKIALQTNS